MFDEIQKELRRLKRQQKVSISIPADRDRYFDRECPALDCTFHFKVHEDDWRDKVRDDKVYCPFCGHTAGSDSWWTRQQLKHAREAAIAQIDDRISNAIRRDVQRWNRQQPKNSFLSVTMKVDSRPRHIMLPPAAAQPMELKITCPECACRYAVIGSAYFCPACGHNAADQMFDQSIKGIRQALDAAGNFISAIPDRDTAENTKWLLIEHSLQSAVTAFQRYTEALYARFPDSSEPRRNAFQNLAEGSDLWRGVTGKGYEDYLDKKTLDDLQRHFQQRHLLAHRQGLVDSDYLRKTGDKTYREGQRIVVREKSVRDCLKAITALSSAMAADCPTPN